MGAAKAVSRILPVISKVSSAIDIFEGITGMKDKKELQHIRRSNRLNQAQVLQSELLEREMRAEQNRADEEQRLTALRRAVASRRARFGARGIGSEDGSSEAVLLGQFLESESERIAREKKEALIQRSSALAYEQGKAGNLLKLTQKAEAMNLERYYKLSE